jgi:hypothetical protein
MPDSTAALITASVSGAVSLAAAAISVANSRGVARLNDELARRREAETKKEQAEQVRARYRDPLLSAAFDLQSRLYNIVQKTFLQRYLKAGDETSRVYAIDNTMYVMAEYLAWVEVIRREIRFLDIGEESANQAWVKTLEEIRNTLARDDIDDAVFRIFRGDQRAIGELMAAPAGEDEGRRECIGYASFVKRRHDQDFARWFDKLEADICLLAEDPDSHRQRLVELQNSLVDLLDVLDPAGQRFPPERRTKVPG